MANIRKTFNFRNGVQVDEDNLIVDSLGKVGIGTSVPTAALDIRGTTNIVGLITASESSFGNSLVSGILTAVSANIGGGVSISQGSISAELGGIVTYFGDGRFLEGLPTSQWLDVDIGLGFTSIYAQGYVGVNTTSPIYPFQVGGTELDREFANAGANGVGIDSSGNIYSTGIVTALSYYGSGAPLTSLTASNISSGTLNNARLPSNISVSGIITASNKFVGNLTGNVTGNVTGNLIGIAGTADGLTIGAGISVGIVTSNILTANSLTVGVITASSKIHSQGSLGIGTQNPQTSLHLFASSGAALKVQNDTGVSYVSIGTGFTRTNNNADLAFQDFDNSLTLSNYGIGPVTQYINRGDPGIGTGNFDWRYGQDNTLLMRLTYDGKLGLNTPSPEHPLHVGGSSTITGTLYVGNSIEVGQDLIVPQGTFNTLNVNADLVTAREYNGDFNSTSGVSTFNILKATEIVDLPQLGIRTDDTDVLLDVFGGESTFGEPRWLDPPDNTIYNPKSRELFSNFWVTDGKVGILTDRAGLATTLPHVTLNALGAVSIFRAVGVGTTNPACAVDFSCAGFYHGAGGTLYTNPNQKRFMLVPRVTSTQRNNLVLASTPFFGPDSLNGEGAVIYNTSTKTFQGYNGSSWSTLGGSGGLTNIADDLTPELGADLNLSGFNIVGVGSFNTVGIATFSALSCPGTFVVGTGVTIHAGIVTATDGFNSGIGTGVQITTVGNQLIFTVPGVGTTSLTLY